MFPVSLITNILNCVSDLSILDPGDMFGHEDDVLYQAHDLHVAAGLLETTNQKRVL